VPILGIFFCAYLMSSLPTVTWIRFFVWMALGLGIYFSYGRFHSRVANHIAESQAAAD
jgi:APA family basic amino acid/polyamine antiporter